MKKWLAALGLAFTFSAHSQNVTISGYIRDAATGEELINAYKIGRASCRERV